MVFNSNKIYSHVALDKIQFVIELEVLKAKLNWLDFIPFIL